MWKKTFQLTCNRAYHYGKPFKYTPKDMKKQSKTISHLLEEVKIISQRIQNLERTLQQIAYRNTDEK